MKMCLKKNGLLGCPVLIGLGALCGALLSLLQTQQQMANTSMARTTSPATPIPT